MNSRKKITVISFYGVLPRKHSFKDFFFERPIKFLGRFYPSLISLNKLPEIFSQIPVSQFVPLNEGLQ